MPSNAILTNSSKTQPRRTFSPKLKNSEHRSKIFTAVEQLREVLAMVQPHVNLDALFRQVHNLKANASANGLNDLVTAAQEFENVLH